MTPDPSNAAATAERVKAAIAYFERSQATLLARRRGAPDGIMVVIDKQLAVNAQTIVALRRSLAFIEARANRTLRPHGGPDESAAQQ